MMFRKIIKKLLPHYQEDQNPAVQNNTDKSIQDAIEKHIAGNLQEAEAIYQSILKEQPDEPDALHLLGLLAHQVGNNAASVDLIERAISVRNDVPDFYFHCGSAYQALDRRDLAIKRYEQALAINPDYFDVLNNLGLLLHGMGQLKEATRRYEQALAVNPNFAEAYNNLGNIIQEMNRPDEAIRRYEQALAIDPDYAEAHNNLGLSLLKSDSHAEAVSHFKRALILNPDYAEAHNNLANSFQESKLFEKAIYHYEQAINIKPDYAEAHNNLGLVLQKKELRDDAINYYKKAINIKPDYAEAHYNLGNILQEEVELKEAVYHYEQAINIKPDYAEAHYNLGFANLLNGSLEKGWDHYEWRYKTPEHKSITRNFSQPQWDGSSLNNQTILLHAEQGLGDTIQFIRYLPMIAEAGGKIIVECDPGLIHLFTDYAKIATFIGKGEPIPDFDVHSSLMSLPKIFGTSYESIPSDTNYINSNSRLVSSWKERLSGTNTFNVGIFWQGNKNYNRDKSRSIPLKQFEAILTVEKTEFVSLQKGDGQEQISENGFSHLISDYTSEMDNEEKFADTVAIINSLDLIIGTDTSIIHLAGAMGKPTWILLAYHPDWRWMLNIESSPWYPTMKLFRQQKKDDWESVINRVKLELEKIIPA